MQKAPTDAVGEYKNYRGDTTWIKDLDLIPDYPLAYVWSLTTKRWRLRRERIRMERLRLFDPSDGLEDG